MPTSHLSMSKEVCVYSLAMVIRKYDFSCHKSPKGFGFGAMNIIINVEQTEEGKGRRTWDKEESCSSKD